MTYKYWHTFDFPEFKTEGVDNSPEKLKFIKMPEDLSGQSVLDVGAWDGYFSFIAEKRGAKVVVAFDSPKHAWNRLAHPIAGQAIIQNGKEGFETVHKALNSKVKDVEGELDQLGNWEETYDIVFDLGILYHCKDPYKHIRDLSKLTNKLLILETHTDANYLLLPAMIFYPEDELNHDAGNWWGPNVACVHDMLITAGFKKIEISFSNGRAVFHAFK